MTSKYFGVPFANSGDKTSIPDASQPSGDVSFEDGWTPDYAKDQAADPNAKDIPRQSENYFKFVISEALKELQEIGAKPYDPLVNYPIGAIIPGSDNIRYFCQIPNGPSSSVKDPVGLSTGEWVQSIPLRSSPTGGVISNDADAAHDITISPYLGPDSLKTEIIQLKSAVTKQIDSIWAAGNDTGGLFLGSVAANKMYAVHIIKKDSDGSIDAGFDIDAIASNIPAGYTAHARVGWVLTDSSANIIPFIAAELSGGVIDIMYNAVQLDFNAPIGSVRQTKVVSAPAFSFAKTSIELIYDSAPASLWVNTTSFADDSADTTNRDLISTVDSQENITYKEVYTNSNMAIAFRANASSTLRLRTQGFIDRRIN